MPICPEINCGRNFTRQYNLNRHYQRYHVDAPIVERCFICGLIFNNNADLQTHYQRVHRPTKKFVVVESAFKKAIVTYRYTFQNNVFNFAQAQNGILNNIKQTIILEAAKKTIVKVGLIFLAEMAMLDHAGDTINTAVIPFAAERFLANASMQNSIHKTLLKVSINNLEH